MLKDVLITILFVAYGLFYIASWIAIIVDYFVSGKYAYRRSLRLRLKDKSLSKMEQLYIHLLLSDAFEKVMIPF